MTDYPFGSEPDRHCIYGSYMDVNDMTAILNKHDCNRLWFADAPDWFIFSFCCDDSTYAEILKEIPRGCWGCSAKI